MLCIGALLFLPGSEESRIRSSYLRFLGRNKPSEEEQWNKLKEEVKETNTVIEIKQPSASVNEQKVVQRSISPPVNITKKFNMSFMNI